MHRIYQAPDWDRYKMVYHEPHLALESQEVEVAVVGECLKALVDSGVLPHDRYPQDCFLAFRQAVREQFEIPWTAITPRMQRLIWAINAIRQPRNMIAAGVFCGNTFISNAGAAAGPGACYQARELLGVEIKPQEALRAENNVRKLDPTGVARVIAADAVEIVRDFSHAIDLLYLDADGDKGRGKGIYLEILQAGLDRMGPSSLVLAHNNVNAADRLADYLAFVRDDAHFKASVNCIVDGEGLEVSVR